MVDSVHTDVEKKQRLSESVIMHHARQSVAGSLFSLHVLESVDSTNQYLLDRLQPLQKGFSVCVSETQTAGRGRNDRVWQSPAGASVYLSTGYVLESGLMSQLSRLPLYCGAALAEWLTEHGVTARLKWPNDILSDGRKLAGLLIETRLQGRAGLVVMGLGLNVDMPVEAMAQVDQPWTDLRQCLLQVSPEAGHLLLNRNWLVAQLVDVLDRAYGYWHEQNDEWFQSTWQQYDILQGQEVQVIAGQDEYSARVCGLADDGALLLQLDGELRQVYAADVKLKIKPC